MFFASVRRHIRLILTVALLAVAFFGGRASVSHDSPIALSVSYPANHVTTVKVPVPVLTRDVVKEFVQVEDRGQVDALLAENRALKVQVTAVSVSHASTTSQGTGTSIIEPIGPPDHIVPPLPPVHVTFTDWRLHFDSRDGQTTYSLTQQFSVVDTIGKNKHGVETHLVRLFEIGPGPVRTPIPTVDTTTIVADTTTAHWYTKLTIQAGVGVAQNPTANAARKPNGVVAVPIFKRGRSRATEDTRWAILTPAGMFSATEQSVGILPVSYNLGSLPRQPFTNLWISPYIGKTATTTTVVGVAMTATF